MFLMRRLGWPLIAETRLQTICIVATVVITTIGTVFAALSYFAMPSKDRPELEPMSHYAWRVSRTEGQPGWHLQIGWFNQGKRLAEYGFVTVYTADERGARQNKLGSRQIVDNTGLVAMSSTDVSLAVSDLPARLLVCASYRDESGKKYRQAFLYHFLSPEPQAGPPPSVKVPSQEEVPRPNENESKKLCR